jgi:hypothetical protein
MESIKEIHECAFQNLEKARVIIAGIVLDGVPFMEEFGLNHHHHTHEQQNTMKQELATMHQQLGFLKPALEDYYQALRISIEACGVHSFQPIPLISCLPILAGHILYPEM